MVLSGSNMFRRGASTRAGDVEEQRGGAPEMAQGGQTSTTARRLSLRLPPLSIGRRAENGDNGGQQPGRTRTNSSTAPAPAPGEIESPKSPEFNINLSNMPSTRLHLPNLPRTWTRGESGPPSPRELEQGGGDPRPSMQAARSRPSIQQAQTEQLPTVAEPPQPAPAHMHPDEQRNSFLSGLRGEDPAEVHRADRDRRRRRQHGHSDGSASSSDPATRQPPKRFLYCFPWIKSRHVRTHILRCFVSGMFLLLTLSIYLALNFTKNINNNEFTILLILIILATTIFFCHGLIKLCLFIIRPETAEEQERARLPNMFGPGGYAIPRRPIRVVLARDEEAAGLESETNKLQPPAYGLWRESVRVDPNRIYWARNEQSPPHGEHEAAEEGSNNARPTTANRPPSYASEDGVTYVVEARPRSVAPLTDVPLPPHRPAW